MDAIDVLNDILEGRVDSQAVRNVAPLLEHFVEVLIQRRDVPAVVVRVTAVLLRQVSFNDCQLIARIAIFMFLPSRSNDEALLIDMVNNRVEGLILQRILVASV